MEEFFTILFKNEFCKFFYFLIGELSEEEHAHIAQRIGLSLFRRLAPRLGLTSSELECLENEVMCLECYNADK